MRPVFGILLAALASSAIPAKAATITRAYSFTGSNIADIIGSAASPVSTVNLKFSVTFDPLVQVINAPGGATLDSANIPLGSAFRYSFIPANSDRMSVGGAANGTFGVFSNNDDFSLDFRNALSPTPEFTVFVFTTAATPGSAFRAFSGVITPLSVPEPASWALMIAGFGMAGGALRTRRWRLKMA